ncbi:MAG: sodium:proton antiporter [Lachnospiraceae bacterium]|nr:sodium:proton antiporter [Lachnospiraceae bacterium]
MEVFNYVLILLAAVLLSNLINRFLPLLSVPVIQIALGMLIAIIPHGAFGYDFYLEPELFFVLFLSPLVFHSARTADLKNMRKMIRPIVLAAVGLVLFSVFIIGFITQSLIPAIPMAAAFALAAALGPTDIVAVEAVAHRVKLPRRIKSILVGESIINDATGLVCFQFAIIAATTGYFNVFHGLGRFFIIAIGGLFLGMFLTVLKFILIRWLRSLHIVVASLHLALGILTPFIIYMIAEELGTSGILAVFGSGIVHAMYKDKLNPEVLSLNNATENIWSFLSFSLDGLVFVMLGAGLPTILRIQAGRASGFHIWETSLYILLIYLAMTGCRFFWWLMTVRAKTYSDPKYPVGTIRAGLIFSVAGARGAVSMAGILSIPLVLSTGALFPERDLIILVTCGVIIISLLMTNFVLPLVVPKGKRKDKHFYLKEQEARDEILKTVIQRLKEAITPENIAATEIIIQHYYARLNKQFQNHQEDEGKRRHFGLRSSILLLEKDVILHMAEMGQLNESQAEHYIEEANRLYDESEQKIGTLQSFLWIVKHFYDFFTWKDPLPSKHKTHLLKEINAKLMREKQNELHLDSDDEALKIISLEHEKVVSARLGFQSNENMANGINEVAENGLYMERVLIQQMMDAGRLSRKTAKEMQANIILLEAKLQVDDSI